MEGNLAILEGNFDWFPGKSMFSPAVPLGVTPPDPRPGRTTSKFVPTPWCRVSGPAITHVEVYRFPFRQSLKDFSIDVTSKIILLKPGLMF